MGVSISSLSLNKTNSPHLHQPPPNPKQSASTPLPSLPSYTWCGMGGAEARGRWWYQEDRPSLPRDEGLRPQLWKLSPSLGVWLTFFGEAQPVWLVGSSLTRDQTRAHASESTESYPLDHQGIPLAHIARTDKMQNRCSSARSQLWNEVPALWPLFPLLDHQRKFLTPLAQFA